MTALVTPPARLPSSPPPVATPSDLPLVQRVLQGRAALLQEVVAGAAPPLRRVVGASLLLTALGGLALGAATGPLQAASAALKAPLIHLGALAIAFPALYVFAALAGWRLPLRPTLRLLAVGQGMRGAVLAGLAPVLLFFGGVGSPYWFLLLCGLLTFGLAEGAFLRTLRQGVRIAEDQTGPLPGWVLYGWSGLYVAVSAQLTWSLRPLIQHPSLEGFRLLEGPGGNMFTYLLSDAWRAVL